MFLVGLGILLSVSFLGSRLQGLSLAMLGSLGVWLFMLLLHAVPAEPPVQVLFCIAAVMSAVGAMEAAGGLDYLVKLAESFIRRHPRRIIYITPLVSYIITFLGGTNHIAYAILPVVAQVSRETGIRAEAPLSLAVIAALHGALASPISSIMITLTGFLTDAGLSIVEVYRIVIPATIGGLCMATCLVDQLNKKIPCSSTVFSNEVLDQADRKQSVAAGHPSKGGQTKLSILFFLLGSLATVILGTQMELPLPKDVLLALVMFSTACLIMLFCRIPPTAITQGRAFTAGIQGMFSLLGIAWLSSTFVEHYRAILLKFIESHLVASWQFFIILLLMSALMGSSAATIKAIFPLGLALGIPAKVLLASAAAANGVFIIPIYPTLLAAIHLDKTGSTQIGRWLFNHSFMLPGLVAVLGAVAIGFLLTYIWLPN